MRMAAAAMILAAVACQLTLPPLDLPLFVSGPAGQDLRLIPGEGGRAYIHGRTIFVSVDSEGHRTTAGAPAPGGAFRRLDIIGDSQIFGWALDDSETIAARLQARLGKNWRVVNHGVPGVGPLRYAEELKTVPPDAEVLVVFTEVNDLWDMYDIARYPTRCGFLSGGTLPNSYVTCAILNLRLVQLGYAVADGLAVHRALAPIGCDETSQIAARILAHRVRALFAAVAKGSYPNLHFTVVPWDGRFNELVRADYFPPADRKAPNYFDDDFAMIDAFGGAPDPAALFLDRDPHLSAAGARLFADRVADVMTSAADHVPASPNMQTGGR
jgi:lysophospholipase L1-like esterase